MRVITAAQQGVLNAGQQGEHVRVSVKDGGGTFRDLTTYPGFNAVKSVTYAEKIDDPHRTFDVVLKRELNKLSLSPFMGASALNLGFNPVAAFAALIALNREVKIETAITAQGKVPVSADWMEVLRGRIDHLDPGPGYELSFGGRDLGGRMAQTFIKKERVYSFAVDGATVVSLRIWSDQEGYTAGEYLIPATRGDGDPGLNRFFKCSQSGTSGSTEPVWTGGAGQVDGTAKWDYIGAPTTAGNPVEKIIQSIITDNLASGDPAVTLVIPASPGWNIKEFIQAREFVLGAVRKLAAQIGWDVRYKWNSTQFDFILYSPSRVAPSVNYTFGKSDVKEFKRLAIDIANIRNYWRVLYSDSADRWPDGTAKRKVVEVSDSASIAKYGELFSEICESDTSGIDTVTEATLLANNALSDCAEPTAEVEVALKRAFPWVELNDYMKFTANGLHFDADQSFAVTGWTQTFSDGKLRTALVLRGKPTIGVSFYIANSVHPDHPTKEAHKRQQFSGKKTASPTHTKTVGGAAPKLSLDVDRNRGIEEYEHHLTASPGGTLDSSSMKTVSKDRNIVFSDLMPGKTYYHRIIERTRNESRLVRGQPSAEVSFVAGYVEPRYLNPQTVLQPMPPNGSFEGQLASDQVPDLWNMVTGTWGAGGDAGNASADSYDGVVAVELRNTAVATKIRSSFFPVTASNRYMLEAYLKKVGTPTQTADLAVEWYTRAQGLISTDVLGTVLSGIGSGWTRVAQYKIAPATAAFAKVYVAKHDNAAFAFYVDAISMSVQDRVMARYSTNAGLTLTNNTFVLVDFEDAEFDTHSAVTTGASWKFTVPTGKAGKYEVTFGLLPDFGVFNGQCIREVRIYKNGSALTEVYRSNATSTSYEGAYGSTVLDLAEGDYIDVRYFQNSGANRALYTDDNYNWVCISRVDPT